MNTRMIGVLVLALARPTVALAQGTDTSRLATITVFNTELYGTIPRDFLGFSLEVSTAGQGIGAFQGPAAAPATEQPVYALGHPGFPNAGFFRFMRDFGPGFLRLGGNSQDNTCWDKAHAPHPEACQAELGAEDLRLFDAAAAASGWKLIVGLNLKQNAPAWALGEVTAGVAREIAPGHVFALEPGNEPDLFARTPYRPKGYAARDQAQEFLAYLHAFDGDSVAHRYPVVGPATCCGWRTPDDLALFADSVGPQRLKWLTVHNYSATTCNGQTVSATRLLSRELMDEVMSDAARLSGVAHERNVPIAMAETNSASCGGMPGVSNAFASALWGLDYAFTLASAGFVNVDYHISYRPGGGSSYNPVDTYGTQDAAGRWRYRNVAEPLYYGLYLFAQQAAGKRFMSIGVEANANVTAYALSECGGCAVSVFVLNKDTSAAGKVRVHLARGMGNASLLVLDAPNVGAGAAGVRYGGMQFKSDGTIGAPRTTGVRPDAAGDYDFKLPNAAIAVLTVRPAGRGRP